MFKYFFVLILLILVITSCQQKEVVSDKTGNFRIALEAEKFLYDCPSFFIPPVQGTSGTLKNESGAIAWTPNFNTGPVPGGFGWESPDTKERYISKINLAKVTNQQNWYQYQKIEGSGYPGYLNSGVQTPESMYQAGFVCFLLAWRAVTDAGYDPLQGAEPTRVDDLTYGLEEITNMAAVRAGDLVFYNFDNQIGQDGEFDHVAIIVDVTGSDRMNWKVVSSIGFIENVEYGAKETRLGAFRSISSGGDFTNWNVAWNNWVPRIYAVPNNN